MQTFTLTPQFEYVIKTQYSTIKTSFDLGYSQARAKWPYPKRQFSLNWSAATEADIDYIDSFMRYHRGPADAFLYRPSKALAPCFFGGSPGSVAQAVGSYGARTYWYGVTQVTAEGETSLTAIESVGVAANRLFRLTPLRFSHRSVIASRVYVGSTSTVYLQATISIDGSSWTESDLVAADGLVRVTNAPALNTAYETITVRLLEDTFPVTRSTAAVYSGSLTFEEII